VPKTRIVLIGAGSVCFGTSTFADLCRAGQRLAGSTVVLVDIDPAGLAALEALFRRMVAAAGVDLRIEATTDRRRALPGAEFVVVSIAVDRERTWTLDFEVPRRHGVRHVLGENGGPGALFHAARNIPPMLAICRDMEELCADALLVNFTNPEPRMCLAVARYSKVRVVGLCHQVYYGVRMAAHVLGRAPGDLDLKAAGINHFTWISDLRDRHTGADLLPEFLTRLRAMPPDYEPLSRQLLDVFGLVPATGDGHAGEYVAWAFGPVGEQGYDFVAAAAERQGMWDDLARVNAGTLPVSRFLDLDVGERVVPLVCGVLENSNHYELAVDLPNRGHIANLPDGPIVEVPGLITGAGVRGVAVGPLPEGLAILCRRQMELASLAVDAAVRGDRSLALQALVLDPVVPDPGAARAILDELLAAERAWLPQFHGGPPAA
jgi:alpha-galactosidase